MKGMKTLPSAAAAMLIALPGLGADWGRPDCRDTDFLAQAQAVQAQAKEAMTVVQARKEKEAHPCRENQELDSTWFAFDLQGRTMEFRPASCTEWVNDREEDVGAIIAVRRYAGNQDYDLYLTTRQDSKETAVDLFWKPGQGPGMRAGNVGSFPTFDLVSVGATLKGEVVDFAAPKTPRGEYATKTVSGKLSPRALYNCP